MTTAPHEVTIDVAVTEPRWAEIAAHEDLIAGAVRQTLAEIGTELAEDAEVSILLCNDAFIAGLNKQYRGRDTATNVLSFPSGDGPDEAHLLGDIVVAFETTAHEAQTLNKTFEDHFTHLVVHGFLHLLGYDHEEDGEAEEMEAVERQVLASLGIEDPYRESQDSESQDRESQDRGSHVASAGAR
jgi:probable rRNA maturation factor